MYDFEQEYGFEFGERKNKPVNFEDLEVNGSFVTPMNRVDEVSFDICDSNGITGNRVLIVADHPVPQLGDDGIVGIQDLREPDASGGYEVARLSMFVNDTAEDPKPPLVRDNTHGGRPYEVPRDTWLQPGRKYYFRIYWAIVNVGQDYSPLPCRYYGTGFGDSLKPASLDVIISGVEYVRK